MTHADDSAIGADDCLARACALAPTIAAAAPDIEATRELTPDIVSALHEAGLFRMLLPRSLGGEELSPEHSCWQSRPIAKADASTAWCVAKAIPCILLDTRRIAQTRGCPQGIRRALAAGLGAFFTESKSGCLQRRLSHCRLLELRQRQPPCRMAGRALSGLAKRTSGPASTPTAARPRSLRSFPRPAPPSPTTGAWSGSREPAATAMRSAICSCRTK